MGQPDPRVDAYIARAAPFAQPLLEQLRAWVHAACPEAEETIKWSMPFFQYHGGILAHMAAFKQHCAFGFWRGKDIAPAKGEEAMGQFGRIESKADLPAAREFKALVKQFMARIDAGEVPKPTKAAAPRPALEAPPDFVAALAREPGAKQRYEAMPPSHRRDYLEWILEAKREATREKRIVQAVEQIAEGKSLHWKYQR